MVDNTLVLVGISRSGTTSLWKFLDKHPNGHASTVKEPIKHKDFSNSDLDTYLKYWDFSKIKNGDIMVDSTPAWWCTNFSPFFKGMTSKFKRVCCVFLIRRPYTELWESRLLLHYRLVMRGQEPEGNQMFDAEGNIKVEYIMDRINLGLVEALARSEKIVGKENIFILDLKDVEKYQSLIYDFLKIDNSFKEKFDRLNVCPTSIFKFHSIGQVASFIEKNRSFIEEKERIEIKHIKERYGKQSLIT